MENADKTRIEKRLNKFDEFCAEKRDEKDIEKCIAKDRKYLQEIGVERLKKALSTMSLTVLYDFLHKDGFKGTRARLIDLLAELKVRARQEKPEKFKNYKCRVKGCDGRLVSAGKNDIYTCEKCGNYHGFENRKIVLIKQAVQEKKEIENKIPEQKPVTQKINVSVNQTVNQTVNNPAVSQQKSNTEKPVAKPVANTSQKSESFDQFFVNGQSQKNNVGNAVVNGMRVEEENPFNNQ